MNSFHHAILANEILIKEVVGVPSSYRLGAYPWSSPTVIWNNGATYVIGYKDPVEFNNSPFIVKWKDGDVEVADVGTIDATDSFRHPFPSLLFINNYIYVFQVNGHGAAIKIWKSNSPDNITDGFTLHHTINDVLSYCSVRLLEDGRVMILTRRQLPYNQCIAISAPNDYTSWTVKDTTSIVEDSGVIRHYPCSLFYYNPSEWFYLGITLRREDVSPELHHGQIIYKTQDFTTFYNLDETFSKNIDTNGAITEVELESYCTIVGGRTSFDYSGALRAAVINDTIYNSIVESGVVKFMKITPDGTITTYPCPLQNIRLINNNSEPIYVFFNGFNLVLLINFIENGRTSRKVYGCDLNFENFQFFEELNSSDEQVTSPIATIPYNFPEVEGEYIITGTGEIDLFPYLITDDKFLI